MSTNDATRPSGKSTPAVAQRRSRAAQLPPAVLMALGEAEDDLVTDAGIVVYSAGSVVERNLTYEVADYAPGFILIGDDSGGRGFLVRVDHPDSQVFSSDLGDLDPTDFEIEAADVPSWVRSL